MTLVPTRALVNKLIEHLGPRVETDVVLGPLTTFRVGGPADALVRVHSIPEVEAVARAVQASGIDTMVVGQGSNLLVGDAGYRGLVIVLGGEFTRATFAGLVESGNPETAPVEVPAEVTAGAGVKMPVLARQAAARGGSGLEWMVGVPGSVGGGVRMNAGGHGSSVSSCLIDVRLWSLDAAEARTVPADQLGLGYRQSNLRPNDVVLTARFALGLRDAASADAELTDSVRWRREHQPGGANCGSVFTNPHGDSAGRLIDSAGLRGFRIGTASVSEKHANFIQADENATAADIWALIIEVRRRVHETFGVVLHPEVRTAGFDASLSSPSSTSPGGSHPIPDVP